MELHKKSLSLETKFSNFCPERVKLKKRPLKFKMHISFKFKISVSVVFMYSVPVKNMTTCSVQCHTTLTLYPGSHSAT